MALRGNNSRFRIGPHKFASGVASVFGGGLAIVPGNFNQSGRLRNFSATNPLASVPAGNTHPNAWVLPNRAGAMSSRFEADFGLTASGLAVGGVNIVGTASMAFDASGTGQLIVSGAGTASFSITATGTAVASLNASGSASMAFSASAEISAIASVSGSANFSITGTLIPYAVGNMSGSTDVATEITNDSVAAAVWSAIASAYNVTGTMGAKLNAASAGGVDYNALAAAILAAAAVDPIAANIKEVNSVPVDGAGTEADPFGPV
jgi:hypothetical protein